MKLPIPEAARSFGRQSAIVMPTAAEIAYAAGFFDGEGSVTIGVNRSHKRTHNPVYTMRIGASQVDASPLFWLLDRWGGSVQPVARKTTQNNQVHIWGCFSRNAAKFLTDVLPFLIVKRERAEVALRFQAQTFQPGARGHTDEHRTHLAELKIRLNALNGHKSRATTSMLERVAA